jgi:hypothetical protein
MVSLDTRREESQKFVRLGNERLHDLVAGQLPDTKPVPFLCECGDDCGGRVEVTLSEWEEVSSQPNHFLIEVGHLCGEGEKFVGFVGEYEVVCKPAVRREGIAR